MSPTPVSISAEVSFRERSCRDVELLQQERPSLPVIVEDVYPDETTSPQDGTVEASTSTAAAHGVHVHPGKASSILPRARSNDTPPRVPDGLEEPSQADGNTDAVPSTDALQDPPGLRRRRRLHGQEAPGRTKQHRSLNTRCDICDDDLEGEESNYDSLVYN